MVIQKFCPKCGKKGIKDNFCPSCDPKNDMVKDIDINTNMTVCSICSKYLFQNKWVKFTSLKDAVISVVKSRFKKKGLVHVAVKIPKHKINAGIELDFDIVITVFSNEIILLFHLSYTICPRCSKKGTQYFEGILQLRNAPQKALDFVRRQAKKDEDRGVYINKEVRHKNGRDFYVTKNSFVKRISKMLQAGYGGEIKLSSRQFSKDTQKSKELHRMTAFVNLPEFSEGDVIKIKKNIYKVLGNKKRLFVLDLNQNKKTTFDYKGLRYEILEKYKTRISKAYPTVEVLHPYNYQSTEIKNRIKERYKTNKEVNVVLDGDYVYLV